MKKATERMIRVRSQIALSALLALGVFPVGCHKNARVQRNADIGRVTKDTVPVDVRVHIPVTDTSVIALFMDTSVANAFSVEGKSFDLGAPGQREALRATLEKERALWEARKPGDYRFLLRVGCFCPGPRGWLLMDVRSGQPLRAWDKTGRSATLTDWNTFTIDRLYDDLERAAGNVAEARIAFDSRWHFPRYVSTSLRVPDSWSIIEVRGFRPNL